MLQGKQNLTLVIKRKKEKMKKIFLILFVSFSLIKTEAQTIADTAIDKFAGTWMWKSSADTILLVLQKQVSVFPNGIANEVLVGWHKYVKNGQLVQPSLQHVGLNFDSSSVPLGTDLKVTLYAFSRTPTRIWFVGFWDLITHKECQLYFELLPNSTTQASWNLYGQTQLPTNLILTKQ